MHDPNLQHHFDTPVQQFDAGKLGMWLFLATEVLLFGGLFVVYSVYRSNHPEIFAYAHTYLDKNLGALNTVILLCSSLTMAWGVRAAQLGQRRLLVALLGLTLVGGLGFMSVKFVEYKAKWEHGLLWARSYDPHTEDHAAPEVPAHAPTETPAAIERSATTDAGPEGTQLAQPGTPPRGRTLADPGAGQDHPRSAPANVQVFFSIYFLMTGLHGLHVLAGMGAIAWILVLAMRGRYSAQYFTPVDLVGLYWHLVDMIWIFLFPLLYLIH